MKDYWNNLTTRKRNLLKLIPVFLIIIALPLTVWVAQQTQNLQQKAALVTFGSRPASGAISLSNCSNVVIENKTFRDLGAGVIAIRLSNCTNVTIRSVDFLNVAEGVYAVNSSNITIIDSRYSNITGPAQPRTGANVANFVQFNNVTGGLIARNKGKGGDTEDIVSIYKSSNVTVEDNHFEGTNWSSGSGSGIALGDDGGSGNIARRNVLVNPGQVGAFIAGGTNHTIIDNIIIGETRPKSNVGVYVWNQYTPACSGNTVGGNRVFWKSASGTQNPYWNAGNCGAVAGSSNIWNDTSLNIETYRVVLDGPSLNPTPTPAPTSASTPTPTLLSVSCGTSLQSKIDAVASGGIIDIAGCTFAGPVNLNKPLTLRGGTITGPTNNRWASLVSVNSNNVRVENVSFRGGGQVISIFGRNNTIIKNNNFRNQIGSAIAMWGEGRGSNDTLIEGNDIVQAAPVYQTSPISGRASENCSTKSLRTTIRSNTFDQGPKGVGWFGAELKCHDTVLFERNNFKGGDVLISLPDTNNVTVKNNTLDLRGSPYWGVEIPKANDVIVSNNTIFGDGPTDGHAVSMNSGSQRTTVTFNTVSNVRTLIDFGGNYITVTDNCLTNVSRITEYESAGTNVTLARNGPCAASTTQPTSTSVPSATPTPTAFVPTPTTTSQACDTNAVGNNKFVGCLYDGTQFETLVSAAPSGNILLAPVSSTQTALSFDWGSGTPNAAVGTEHWSIRWKGNFTFPAGTYIFTGGSDDGIRVRFNGVTKINVWTGRAYGESSFTETFSAPTTVKIEIDYNEYGVPGKVNFRWTGQNPTPTSTPTTAPTPSPTSTPTVCTADAKLCPDGSYVSRTGPSCAFAPCPPATPTPTPAADATLMSLNLKLHGVGKGGDNANPTSLGNQNPTHTQKTISVSVFNSSNQLISNKSGTITYQSSPGVFTGTIDMGSNLSSGVYSITLKTEKYLTRLIPIQNIISRQNNSLPQVALVVGDVNGDNKLNILDFNILIGCYGEESLATSCSPSQKQLSDLDDNGSVDQFDYNLFLREFSAQSGDSI